MAQKEKKSAGKEERTKKTTRTSGSAKKSSAKKSKSKKKKISVWKIILLILIAAFLVYFFCFNGRAKIDSFLTENFGTNTQQIFNPQQEEATSSQEKPAETKLNSEQTKASTSQDQIQGSANDSFATKEIEIPLCPATLNGSAEDHEVHSYNGFQLCYRETYEDAEWVAYTLTKDELNAVTDRSNKFKADTKISTGSAIPGDYTKSGYDRGHLAPAADLEWSVASMEDSFLMSNMTPQAPDFNRGIWKTLEEQVRTWAGKFGEVTVVTGPILEKAANEYKTIGKNEVAVPEYFYKALLAKDSDGNKIAVGFILPNQKCDGEIWDYAVSIDEIEKRTGLDFFSLLNDSEENSLEANTNFSEWK